MDKEIEYTNGELTIIWQPGFMPTRRSVRENVTQGIQSQRKTLGQNRERHNGRINRTN